MKEPIATVADCKLEGSPIFLCRWTTLGSDQLARIVGVQEPGGFLEDARDYEWTFQMVPIEKFRFSNQDGEEPDGGWVAAHKRFLASDAEAAADGSSAYAGRDRWLSREWCPNTAIYPVYAVYAVEEDSAIRLWDGHRRVSGAFAHGVKTVATLLGRPVQA